MAAPIELAPAGEPFRLTFQSAVRTLREGRSLVVELSGEIDLSNSEWLADALADLTRPGREVVVDLERVEFMDCTGLRVLVDATERSRPGEFCVTPGPLQVQRLFALSGMGERLCIVPPRSAPFAEAAA